MRHLELEFGRIDLSESIPAAVWLLHWAHQVEHWWAVGADDAYRPLARLYWHHHGPPRADFPDRFLSTNRNRLGIIR